MTNQASKVLQGDCLVKLKEIADNSVDAIITDPPYELGFMGKSWDNTGIANNKEMWAECLRVLKPGGHLLAFSGTRTYHRMAVAIEDAGFEVRDMIEWVYGSGFPKSRNIGLDVDKRNGVTKNRGKAFVVAGQSGQKDKDTGGDLVPGSNTMGAYQAQNEWNGWGTALKPAHEPICMARKPLSEKTVAENCLKWKTGGINIDESRVDTITEEDKKGWRNENSKSKSCGWLFQGEDYPKQNELGRFPANLIHDNSEEVRECFPETGKSSGGIKQDNHPMKAFGSSKWKIERGKANAGGLGDSGSASRFFKSIIYTAKASKSERNNGCEGLPLGEPPASARSKPAEGRKNALGNPRANNHPTVKPVALMEYLIKMVTPKGGIVLDPFMGSGTTGIACRKLNYGFIGIELEPDYITIAKARINSIKAVQEKLL